MRSLPRFYRDNRAPSDSARANSRKAATTTSTLRTGRNVRFQTDSSGTSISSLRQAANSKAASISSLWRYGYNSSTSSTLWPAASRPRRVPTVTRVPPNARLSTHPGGIEGDTARIHSANYRQPAARLQAHSISMGPGS